MQGLILVLAWRQLCLLGGDCRSTFRHASLLLKSGFLLVRLFVSFLVLSAGLLGGIRSGFVVLGGFLWFGRSVGGFVLILRCSCCRLRLGLGFWCCFGCFLRFEVKASG